MTQRAVKQRHAYDFDEDMAILNYIIRNNKFLFVNGIDLWQKMYYKKVTTHSAQSMRTHFLKVIMKNIESFPISDAQKKLFLSSAGTNVGHNTVSSIKSESDDTVSLNQTKIQKRQHIYGNNRESKTNGNKKNHNLDDSIEEFVESYRNDVKKNVKNKDPFEYDSFDNPHNLNPENSETHKVIKKSPEERSISPLETPYINVDNTMFDKTFNHQQKRENVAKKSKYFDDPKTPANLLRVHENNSPSSINTTNSSANSSKYATPPNEESILLNEFLESSIKPNYKPSSKNNNLPPQLEDNTREGNKNRVVRIFRNRNALTKSDLWNGESYLTGSSTNTTEWISKKTKKIEIHTKEKSLEPLSPKKIIQNGLPEAENIINNMETLNNLDHTNITKNCVDENRVVDYPSDVSSNFVLSPNMQETVNELMQNTVITVKKRLKTKQKSKDRTSKRANGDINTVKTLLPKISEESINKSNNNTNAEKSNVLIEPDYTNMRQTFFSSSSEDVSSRSSELSTDNELIFKNAKNSEGANIKPTQKHKIKLTENCIDTTLSESNISSTKDNLNDKIHGNNKNKKRQHRRTKSMAKRRKRAQNNFVVDSNEIPTTISNKTVSFFRLLSTTPLTDLETLLLKKSKNSSDNSELNENRNDENKRKKILEAFENLSSLPTSSTISSADKTSHINNDDVKYSYKNTSSCPLTNITPLKEKELINNAQNISDEKNLINLNIKLSSPDALLVSETTNNNLVSPCFRLTRSQTHDGTKNLTAIPNLNHMIDSHYNLRDRKQRYVYKTPEKTMSPCHVGQTIYNHFVKNEYMTISNIIEVHNGEIPNKTTQSLQVSPCKTSVRNKDYVLHMNIDNVNRLDHIATPIKNGDSLRRSTRLQQDNTTQNRYIKVLSPYQLRSKTICSNNEKYHQTIRVGDNKTIENLNHVVNKLEKHIIGNSPHSLNNFENNCLTNTGKNSKVQQSLDKQLRNIYPNLFIDESEKQSGPTQQAQKAAPKLIQTIKKLSSTEKTEILLAFANMIEMEPDEALNILSKKKI